MGLFNFNKSNLMFEEKKQDDIILTGNEEELEIKCSDINEDNVKKILELRNLKYIRVTDSNDIDLNSLLLLLKNPSLVKIDIDEATIVGNDNGYLSILLLNSDFSKVNINKVNLNLSMMSITNLLPLLNDNVEIGKIKSKFTPFYDHKGNEINIKILENFEKEVENLQYTIEYEGFNFQNCEIIKDIYKNNLFGFFDNTPTNIKLLDPNSLYEDDFREYLQKYKGKKVLNVLGNMPISKRMLEIMDEELGDLTLNVLGTIDIKPSVENSNDINYASIYRTSSTKQEKGMYTVIYNDIKIKNNGKYPTEIGYINIDGIKDFDEFFPEFNDMTADCNKIILKTSNKTIPNIESIFKYEDRKDISVEYQNPYSTSNSALYNFAKLQQEQYGLNNTDKCSVDDFIGMRETIDWIKEIAHNQITTDLGLIFFVYDFIKTFPYKENENDKKSARQLSSVLGSEYMVCVGYATLFSQILNELGIKSIIAMNDNHAYNIVKIDDEESNIHGLYRFDATNNNIYKYNEYLKKNSMNQMSEYFKLGSENFLYDMGFKKLSPTVTNFGQDIYPASNFEKDIIEYASTGIIKSVSLDSDLKYLFGDDYTQETVDKYVNTKEIDKKEFLSGLIMGKELQGYTIEDVFDSGYKSSELWESSKNRNNNTKENNMKSNNL